MCKPCNNARNAIEAIANKVNKAKGALAHMKTNDPEAWRAKVRALRIRDPPLEPGASSLADQLALITQPANEAKQTSKVRENTKVHSLSTSIFTAYHMQWERMKEEAAIAA